MRHNRAADWSPYLNGILPDVRPPSAHNRGCRVALRKAAATDFGGLARRTTTAVGTLHPRAVADDDAASQEIQEGTSAETASDDTTSGCGFFGFRGGRMNKNLPVKACRGVGGVDGWWGPLGPIHFT